MVKVLREPTRKDALNLLPINREELTSEVKIGGHLSHSNHEVNKFKVSVGRRNSTLKTSTLDIRRADFRFLRELVSRVPWENTFEGAGIHQCWSSCKHYLLRSLEQDIPKCWK